MKQKELLKLISFNEEYQSSVGIPNYLFNQLNLLVKQKKLKSQHIGFAFSYIYFITYMARYAKYDCFLPSTKQIKEILGYSATNKTIDYIIKKDGLLDKAGITKTIDDFPVVAEWKEDYSIVGKNKSLEITFASEIYPDMTFFKNERKANGQTMCKIPLFGFYNNPDNWGSGQPYDGTFFFGYDETGIDFTLIDFRVFAYCMEKSEELGCNAFYLYCYLKSKNDIYNGYNATSKRLAQETGLSQRTVEKYRDNMRSYNMMTLWHEMDYFVIGGQDLKDKKASNNIINTYQDFTNDKITYHKLDKIGITNYLKKLEQEEHIKEIVEEGTSDFWGKCNF